MNTTSANCRQLFVDADGTYLKTDLLLESFIVAIRNNPLVVIYCFYWLLRGISYLKYELSLRADIDTNYLPINPEFKSFLDAQKLSGRKIILATAAAEKYAKAVVKSSDVFDDFISSSETINLKSKSKLNQILKSTNDFAYAGNDQADFVLFEQAKEKYLVNPTSKILRQASKFEFDNMFDIKQPSLVLKWVKQMRVHQWLKNLLVFVPLLVSGLFTVPTNLALVAIGFISFSLLASATYIINDLFDLPSDRQHSRKCNRPIAAGNIAIIHALFVSLSLLILAFILAYLAGISFIVVLLSYLILTLLYSYVLKRYVAIDTVTLALLYTIRIIAGAAILQISVSFWLFSFSIFIFLSLALVKRCAELKSLENQGQSRASGRDYAVDDYLILANFGVTSAMLSLLMFSFYINNNALNNQYQEPNFLWIIVLGLCYWLMRIWIKTHRGEMHDDPER